MAKIISILIFTEVIGSNVILGGVDDEAVGGKEKPFPQIGAKRSHHQIPTKVTSTHGTRANVQTGEQKARHTQIRTYKHTTLGSEFTPAEKHMCTLVRLAK